MWIDDDPRSLLYKTGQREFVASLYGLPISSETAVSCQWLEPLDLVFQIRYPSLADVSSDERAQFWIAEREPATRCHTVSYVEKLLRRYPVEVAEHRLLQQFGMKSGDSIDGVAARAGEMRHAHVFAPRFVYQRKPPHELMVIGIAYPQIIQKPAIDLEDDLQMARQQAREQRQRPSFKGFGKKRVVRVSAGLLRDTPGLIPVHAVLIHKQPHQFGDGDGGMRVVQLNGPVRMELTQWLAAPHKQADHVLERTGHEKVLLFEPELLACFRLVVGIKHLRNGLRGDLLLHRPVIVPDIERREIEGLSGFGPPQTQHVCDGYPIAGHRSVVGDTPDHSLVNPAHAI